MGTSRFTLLAMVRDKLSEAVQARFMDDRIYEDLQAGLNDLAWRLPDDSAMALRRTKTQVTASGTAFYALASDFMREGGILSATLDGVPCTPLGDVKLLEGYKQNYLLAPSLADCPLIWVGEQTITTVLTWCVNVYPTPDATGQLVYIYRAIPATLSGSQDSELPSSTDEAVVLYALMKQKGLRDGDDIGVEVGQYKTLLQRLGCRMEGWQ